MWLARENLTLLTLPAGKARPIAVAVPACNEAAYITLCLTAHRSQVTGYIADDLASFRMSPGALASLISGPEQFFI